MARALDITLRGGSGRVETPVALLRSDVVAYALELRSLHERGEYWLALEKALQTRDHPTLGQVSESYLRVNERMLMQLCEWKVGALERAPSLAMTPDQLMRLKLDHRAGFLMSLVDGKTSFEEIVQISQLVRLHALFILGRLLELGAIRR
ncbi:MAG: hypothetical protein AB2A00_36465 [Myxococcota bacterium]